MIARAHAATPTAAAAPSDRASKALSLVETLEANAARRLAYEVAGLRSSLRDRHRHLYAPGTYARRYHAREALRRVRRIRAFRAEVA